jgi:hypothetical protein
MAFLCFFISSTTGIGLDVMKQTCFNCQKKVDAAEAVKKYAKANGNSVQSTPPTSLPVSTDLPIKSSSFPHSLSQSPWETADTPETSETPTISETPWALEARVIVMIVLGALVVVVLVFALLWKFVRRRPSDEDSLTQPINHDIEKDSIHGFKNTESTSLREGFDSDSSSGSSSSLINFQGNFEESKV